MVLQNVKTSEENTCPSKKDIIHARCLSVTFYRGICSFLLTKNEHHMSEKSPDVCHHTLHVFGHTDNSYCVISPYLLLSITSHLQMH